MKKYQIKILISISIACAVTVWWLVSQLALHGPRIVFISVGLGDAIFIEDSEGNQILIDTGPDASVVRGLGKILPVWDRSLDAVFLTHAHADHVGGFTYLSDQYSVKHVYLNAQEYVSPIYEAVFTTLQEHKLPVSTFLAGDTIRTKDLTITSHWPKSGFDPQGPVNDSSMVLLVKLAQVTSLLTSDVELARQEFFDITAKVGNIDILKMPHQGNKRSVNQEVLRRIDPEVCVYSVGKNNFGHPDPNTVTLTKQYGAYVLRTDENGSIGIIPNPSSNYSIITKYD